MRWHRFGHRLRGILLAAVALAGMSGCMSFLHPIEPLTPQQCTAFQACPSCSQGHVYIFMVHGLDPLDYANLAGVRDYLHALGFRKIYLGQLYHTLYFDGEIHRLHQEDPQARFVLIGFSFGANMVSLLANSAKTENIPIDLLVYLGGNTLHNDPIDQPDNALKIVNILASGCIWNGTTMDRAENISIPEVYHFGSPSHQGTLEVLRRELAVVAGHASLRPPLSSAPPLLTPLPEPSLPPETSPRDEWDFLKPVAHLNPRVNSLPISSSASSPSR